MTGDPVTPWLVTAWQYGLLNGYEDEVFALLKQNADEVPPASSPANGRVGNPSYIANGYVPFTNGASGKPGDYDFAHGASATMEYAVADCSLSTLAAATGHQADAERYQLRSRNWRSLLDPTHEATPAPATPTACSSARRTRPSATGSTRARRRSTSGSCRRTCPGSSRPSVVPTRRTPGSTRSSTTTSC